MWQEDGDFIQAEEWLEKSPELSAAERAALRKVVNVP
jgi:hypothetical protein